MTEMDIMTASAFADYQSLGAGIGEDAAKRFVFVTCEGKGRERLEKIEGTKQVVLEA